jgi:NADP-dependent 3-hydroxy acid dehydrogenase YdfG
MVPLERRAVIVTRLTHFRPRGADTMKVISPLNPVRDVLAKTGRIDVLVNNAGTASAGVSEAFTPDQARTVFDTNVIGLLRVTRGCCRPCASKATGWWSTSVRSSGVGTAPGHSTALDKGRKARQAAAMPKVRKTAVELEAIVRAEAVRVIGLWPVGLRMLIFPLGDNWRATFSLEHFGLANYRDVVLPIVVRLRNEFDIIEL